MRKNKLELSQMIKLIVIARKKQLNSQAKICPISIQLKIKIEKKLKFLSHQVHLLIFRQIASLRKKLENFTKRSKEEIEFENAIKKYVIPKLRNGKINFRSK